jgi:hypothetical protein
VLTLLLEKKAKNYIVVINLLFTEHLKRIATLFQKDHYLFPPPGKAGM